MQKLYEKLMRSRRENPKHYGLTTIAVAYEDVLSYSRSEKKDGEELEWRISMLSKRMKEVMNIYKITLDEVAEYFRFHNYSLDFIQ